METRTKGVESTRTPRPGSRRNSLGKPAPIRSIHLLHGQPTRTSGELECERNYLDQQRCVYRTRRTWCSAKHTCRMSVWWWRRAVALQADDEHHVRHGRAVGAPPAASTGGVSSSRTQPAPRRLGPEDLCCCHTCVRQSIGMRPSGLMAAGLGTGLAPSGPSADRPSGPQESKMTHRSRSTIVR